METNVIAVTNGAVALPPEGITFSIYSLLIALIPFVVLGLIELVKWIKPRIPSQWLMPLAMLIGTVLEQLAFYVAGVGINNPALGAALGAAASGLRSGIKNVLEHQEAKTLGEPVPSPASKAEAKAAEVEAKTDTTKPPTT